MRFRLVYQGRLKGGNTKDRTHIHEIRQRFHEQLRVLWQQEPASEHRIYYLQHPPQPGYPSLIDEVGGTQFTSLISSRIFLLAQLDILLLRPAPPGSLFEDGGDIDNRIKTLIDALRVPKLGELPSSWSPDDNQKPLHCLLEDDKLVVQFAVETDRLLVDNCHEQDAYVVVTVSVKASKATLDNAAFVL